MKRLLPLLVLLAACTAQLAPQQAGPAKSLDWYRMAAASGTPVYAVGPAASLVAVKVGSAGPLARLGHDHVIASRNLTGYAAPDAGRADVVFRADQLTVDEPELHREAGLGTQPSPQAIEGTRANMLAHVLDADRYPEIRLHAERTGAGPLRVAITLHGVTRWIELPATVHVDPAMVTASGSTRLKQTDFGITPFSVGAGLLSVRDEIEVDFKIIARRWQAPGQASVRSQRLALADPLVELARQSRRHMQPELGAAP
ncbi:YceI family protein [Massilia horti]|uniref:YceI family protein n=1 Tax=Massilia horti TaxID=2562153 RepID=A0A4Y9T421_9BURK|nr:YceI family protein [Massilia horti]TFW34843.1 YceI family protein [Massilia horti]